MCACVCIGGMDVGRHGIRAVMMRGSGGDLHNEGHGQIWMVGWRWGGWELKMSDQILIREHQAIKQ